MSPSTHCLFCASQLFPHTGYYREAFPYFCKNCPYNYYAGTFQATFSLNNNAFQLYIDAKELYLLPESNIFGSSAHIVKLSNFDNFKSQLNLILTFQ